MVARAEVALHDARLRAFGHAGRGKDVVEAPSDVALAHVAPRRPPGEEAGVVRVELAPDIDEVLAQQFCKQLTLFAPLSHELRVALARMHVDLGARDVHVAAQDELTPLVAKLPRPGDQPLHEINLRGVVLVAVGHVDRGDDELAELRLHDARLHVERGMAENRLFRKRFRIDVERDARIRLHPVPERVVTRDLALLRDLRGLGFQLLQAHHVRALPLEPLAELRLARANAVDIPSGDLHASKQDRRRRRQFPALDASDDGGELLVAGRGHPDLCALARDIAVHRIDLGAPPLDDVLRHRRALDVAAGVGTSLRHNQGLQFRHRPSASLSGFNIQLRLGAADLLELVAEGLADADALRGERNLEAPERGITQALAAGNARGGAHAGAHAVLHQLRPALAPQVGGGLGAVDAAEPLHQLLDAPGDAAVRLADAEHGVLVAAFRRGLADASGFVQVDRDHRGDGADHAPPADHAGDGLLVHAILQ